MINELRAKILSELNSLNWIAEVIDW
jgi:hypothetical protein